MKVSHFKFSAIILVVAFANIAFSNVRQQYGVDYDVLCTVLQGGHVLRNIQPPQAEAKFRETVLRVATQNRPAMLVGVDIRDPSGPSESLTITVRPEKLAARPVFTESHSTTTLDGGEQLISVGRFRYAPQQIDLSCIKYRIR